MLNLRLVQPDLIVLRTAEVVYRKCRSSAQQRALPHVQVAANLMNVSWKYRSYGQYMIGCDPRPATWTCGDSAAS
jgi:hypothetical protein